MLTVIMECRDQETELAQTLSVLVAGAVEGLVSDVVVLDHGSTDGSSDVADAAGCRFYLHWDLAEIVRAARGEWQDDPAQHAPQSIPQTAHHAVGRSRARGVHFKYG